MCSRRCAIGGFVSIAVIAAVLNVASDVAAVPSTGPVFINEIHYDDASTDDHEGIEIAGPAGTSLAGWTVVHYRADGTVVRTITLSGTIPDQQAGFGTLWFGLNRNDLQNGNAGLALIDTNNSDAVAEFISYEGTVTATAGAASGMTSTDIGFRESGSEVDMSLQLTGTGTVAADFTWAAPQTHTRDAVNTGQTFVPPVPFINEIHYDDASTDDHEGVEIAGVAGTDLAGWTVVHYRADGTVVRTITLSGTIPDQQAGFGTLWFGLNRNDLQNSNAGLGASRHQQQRRGGGVHQLRGNRHRDRRRGQRHDEHRHRF